MASSLFHSLQLLGVNLLLPLGPAAVEELGPTPAIEVAVLLVLAFFVALYDALDSTVH